VEKLRAATFNPDLFGQMFLRMSEEKTLSMTVISSYTDIVYEQFKQENGDFEDVVTDVVDRVLKDAVNVQNTVRVTKQIYDDVIDRIFARYEWLDLYIQRQNFFEPKDVPAGDIQAYREFCQHKLVEFYGIFHELYPDDGNEQITEILLYVLNNPESNLKQRTVAEHMHINSTFLSTTFSAHTRLHFVNYLASVRLYRAAYLLLYSNLKIVEIASRLSYKDAAYFSRIFKKKFRVNPSEYRADYAEYDDLF
jgi:YesN/AraC family two-component response regulator